MILLALLLLWGSAHALSPFEATYRLGTAGMTLGETRQTLTPQGGERYLFRAITRSKGFLSLFLRERLEEESLFRHQKGHIVPLRYAYRRQGRKKRAFTVRFLWTQGVAEVLDGGTRTLPLPPGALDRLSFQIALMGDLRRGRRAFAYTVVDRKRLKSYRFRVTGEEAVPLPQGPVRALRIEKEGQGKRRTVFWCAPALDFLPVKISYTEKDGRRFVSLLRRYIQK